MPEPRRAVDPLRRERGPGSRARLDALHTRVLACGPGIEPAVQLAVELGLSSPAAGEGETDELWEMLATVAAADVAVARVVEPHLDALAILRQLPIPADIAAIGAGGTSTWGVFAAEGAGTRVTAEPQGGAWVLDGVKPWCSLAGLVSHALVTAYTPDGGRRLFAIAMAQRGVSVREGVWAARGLTQIPSGPIELTAVPAVPVGNDGWYLSRPGFAWGGLGVAAIWWGAAVGIARQLDEHARSREPDQIALMHLGAADAQLECGRLALGAASTVVDAGVSDPGEMRILAQRTRTIVANAAEEVIARCGHSLGPAPLALDARHAGRVADLGLYLRQDHAERDEAALGRALLSREERPW